MKWFTDALFRNFPEKLWAVVITVVVWTIVIVGQVEKRSFDIRVRFIVGENKIITSEVPPFVHVEVESNLFRLLSIPTKELSISQDLSHLKRNKLTIYFDSQTFAQLGNVHITSISPRKVTVEMAPKITKEVDVDPYVIGRPLFGYRIASVSASPARVTIIGPKNEVEMMDTVSTGKINVAGAKEDRESTVPITIGNPHITAEGEPSIKVTVEIERDIRTREFRFVPLKVDKGAVAVIQPATVGVNLRGPVDVLQQLWDQNKVYAAIPYRPLSRYRVKEYTVKGIPDSVAVTRKQKIKKITVIIKEKPAGKKQKK